ncbi:MAG: sulfotransferase family protein [Acidimicrobiales bacterium]
MGDRPVIVIGAGRSGTNLLRDIICAFDGFGTWPCDEINYIWRHGNRDAPTDELRPDDARPEVARFIKRAFDKQRRRQGGGAVVEKTCANSLRVSFVDRVMPDARFVYIVRDGRDVVASAMQRWTAPLDLPYLARKARFVPRSDLTHYGLRYVGSRLHRFRSHDRRLSSWGPRISGYEELAAMSSLAEVCARQWRRCVELAEEQLAGVNTRRVHRLRYEALAHDPGAELERLAAFLGEPAPPRDTLPEVSALSVGQWASELSPRDQSLVAELTSPSLEALGY